MVCGRLPNGACRQCPRWTASKDRATAHSTTGINTRSIILSPDSPSAHLGKAGRPRARNLVRSSITDKEVAPQTHRRDRTLTTHPTAGKAPSYVAVFGDIGWCQALIVCIH